jgi:hypothetical protein
MTTPKPIDPVEESTPSESVLRDGRSATTVGAGTLELFAGVANRQVLNRATDGANVWLDRDSVIKWSHSREANRRKAPIMSGNDTAVE